MNFQNVILVSRNTVPYNQKRCPVTTPLKTIDFRVITGHVS